MFWMGGVLATGLLEISHDPSCLDDGDFWAVTTNFEGGFTAAKFQKSSTQDFPYADWPGLTGDWISSLSQVEYKEYVERIRSAVGEGWVYQVNACRVLKNATEVNSLQGLFAQILQSNPAPWASFLQIPGINIASASPELFLLRTGDWIRTSPIKGTAPTNETSFGNKDRAENIMIVDLMRNDIGQICQSGTVEVPRLLATEQHPGLQHLVSDIEGQLVSGIAWKEIFAALSPPGSVSGAPKSSALQVIAENETARGPYCGVLGWVHGDRASLSVAIRTFWIDGGINFGTGAGITWSSDSAEEWQETVLKADRLISIAQGRPA
jgi:para-aminobenzoate synthetase component 1